MIIAKEEQAIAQEMEKAFVVRIPLPTTASPLPPIQLKQQEKEKENEKQNEKEEKKTPKPQNSSTSHIECLAVVTSLFGLRSEV